MFFAGVYLFVSKITPKVLNVSFWNFYNMSVSCMSLWLSTSTRQYLGQANMWVIHGDRPTENHHPVLWPPSELLGVLASFSSLFWFTVAGLLNPFSIHNKALINQLGVTKDGGYLRERKCHISKNVLFFFVTKSNSQSLPQMSRETEKPVLDILVPVTSGWRKC